MKIAYITDTFPPLINGVVTSILNFSKHLSDRGHSIHIFTIKPPKKTRITLGANVTVTYYARSNFTPYPDYNLAVPKYSACFRALRKLQPDIIHIHTPTPLGWEALISGKVLGIPVIGTYHTLIPEFVHHTPLPERIAHSQLLKRIAWHYTNQFYGNCDLIIAPSHAIKKELRKNGLKKTPIDVVSNGIDLTLFYPKKQKKNIDLLHVGRLSHEKNIDVILRALAIVRKSHPKIHLIIAGKGPDEVALRTLTYKLGLTTNVTFVGSIAHHKLVHLYNKAKLFVTASTIETEGLVVLEAMACGLPIIAVKKLALNDLIKGNGLLSMPGRPKEFANNIITLLTHEKKCDVMQRRSLRNARRYAIANSINKIETIYVTLAQKEHTTLLSPSAATQASAHSDG